MGYLKVEMGILRLRELSSYHQVARSTLGSGLACILF
jgi:hypothetical protein